MGSSASCSGHDSHNMKTNDFGGEFCTISSASLLNSSWMKSSIKWVLFEMLPWMTQSTRRNHVGWLGVSLYTCFKDETGIVSALVWPGPPGSMVMRFYIESWPQSHLGLNPIALIRQMSYLLSRWTTRYVLNVNWHFIPYVFYAFLVCYEIAQHSITSWIANDGCPHKYIVGGGVFCPAIAPCKLVSWCHNSFWSWIPIKEYQRAICDAIQEKLQAWVLLSLSIAPLHFRTSLLP